MHFGVIATTGTAEELLASLASYGTFRAGASLASVDEAPEVDANGEKVMVAGDHAGCAYILDPVSLVAGSTDVIVDASRRLGRRVMSIGAETTSGTYFLMAATSGRLERLHWSLLSILPTPYDVGDALAGEPIDGLDDVDGDRLRTVMARAGFDFEAWMAKGRKVIVEAAFGEPVSGPDGAALNAYMEANIPPGAPDMQPIVAKRSDGLDLVAPRTRMPDGSRVGEKEDRGGLLGRLFGRR